MDIIDSLDEESKKRLLFLLNRHFSEDMEDIEIIEDELQQQLAPEELLLKAFQNEKASGGFVCPYYHSQVVVRNGTYKRNEIRRQRYHCKACGKTFIDLTQTPLRGTWYLDKWNDFAHDTIEGKPLRESAEKLEVTLPTAFYWRHKPLETIEKKPDKPFNGIVESDETLTLYSEKGKRHLDRKPRKRGGHSDKRGISKDQVCILVTRDREGKSL